MSVPREGWGERGGGAWRKKRIRSEYKEKKCIDFVYAKEKKEL